MTKAIILFADNDPDFLKTRAEFIEQDGYHVIAATNPTQARRVLEKGDVDLAILDIRLRDDDDEKDTSGITLARNIKKKVPIIMLTSFPTVDNVRESLRPQMAGLPAANDFVGKEEGPEALIWAIRRAIGYDSRWLRKVQDAIVGIDHELQEDYDDAQEQSKTFFRASIRVASVGIILIFLGTLLAYFRWLEIGIASTVGGILTEAISYLFFTRADKANDRMDRYHKEKLEGHRFETLLHACDGFDSIQKRERCRKQVIIMASTSWLDRTVRQFTEPADSEGDKQK